MRFRVVTTSAFYESLWTNMASTYNTDHIMQFLSSIVHFLNYKFFKLIQLLHLTN